MVLDLHKREKQERRESAPVLSIEARLVESMKKGMTLREAQDELIQQGEKKNAVKQAALLMKKLFSE